jgi:hypothetical protein
MELYALAWLFMNTSAAIARFPAFSSSPKPRAPRLARFRDEPSRIMWAKTDNLR